MYDPTESPFPFALRNGTLVTDERCTCGALRSQHASTMAYGHGPRHSPDGAVLCERYTWARFVFTTTNIPPGFVVLDDSHAVKIEKASVRSVGAKGYRYEVRDLSKPARDGNRESRGAATGAKLFTTTAPGARTRAQALEHAKIELSRHLELRQSLAVLEGGAA